MFGLETWQLIVAAIGVLVLFFPKLAPIEKLIGGRKDDDPPVPDRERWIQLVNAALTLIAHYRSTGDEKGLRSAEEAYERLVAHEPKPKPPTLDPPE